MSRPDELPRLRGELLRAQERLARLGGAYADFQARRDAIPRDYDLVVLSEVFSDFYTALETTFFRISQYFENNLSRERWHRDLLDRMGLTIPGLRPRVLASGSR